MDLIKEAFLIAAMDGKEQHMGSFGNMKGEKVMSKIIPLLMGSWITFCTMVGDYGGAAFLLFFYLLMLRSYRNKKSASAGDTSATKKIILFRRL